MVSNAGTFHPSDIITGIFTHYRHSPRQYRKAFETWGSTKNVTKAEWECILSYLRKRESLGKLSNVEVRGTVVCAEKIRKQRKLYEFQTTYETFRLSEY
jgi:hypothetical protein